MYLISVLKVETFETKFELLIFCGNTQTPTPPAESQQPSSNDSTGSTDNPWGVVPQDASELDWSGGGREWH